MYPSQSAASGPMRVPPRSASGTYSHSPYAYRSTPIEGAQLLHSSQPTSPLQAPQASLPSTVHGINANGSTSGQTEMLSSSPVKVVSSRYRHSPYSPTQQVRGGTVGSYGHSHRSPHLANSSGASAFPTSPLEGGPTGFPPASAPVSGLTYTAKDATPTQRFYGSTGMSNSYTGGGVEGAGGYYAAPPRSPSGSVGGPPSYRIPTHPHQHPQYNQNQQQQQQHHQPRTSNGPSCHSASYRLTGGPPLGDVGPDANGLPIPQGGGHGSSNSYAPSGFAVPQSMASSNHSSPRPPPVVPVAGRNSNPPSPVGAHQSGARVSSPNSPLYRNGSYGGAQVEGGAVGHPALSGSYHQGGLTGAVGGGGGALREFGSAPVPSTFHGSGGGMGRLGEGRGGHRMAPFGLSMNSGSSKTVSTTLVEETSSSSMHSCSSASSVRDDLPLCPNDDACALINDRKHQRKHAHTCRLFPCYHGHIARHAKLFRHVPGQISQPEGVNTSKLSTHALASVNFSTISPEAPNAYRIYVSHGDKSYEIFGDWASVKIHTFKRYLHQVYHIAPSAQVLIVMKTGKHMEDDISSVKSYGIEEDSVIQLKNETELDGPARVPIDEL